MNPRGIEAKHLPDFLDRRAKNLLDVEGLRRHRADRVQRGEHAIGLVKLGFPRPGLFKELSIVNGNGGLAAQRHEKLDFLAR